MSRRLLLALLCLIGCVRLMADPVSASQARNKASQFLNKRVASHARRSAPAAAELKMMAAGKDDSYYIFNVGDDAGFVVVSGEDATEEILGYSDTGSINPDSMPCGMRMLFDNYVEQIKYLRDNGITREQIVHPKKGRQEFHLDTSQLARFGQHDPYNDECPGYWFGDFPTIYDHCPTGCVATAMAQLMFAYQWPQKTTNTISAYKSEKHGYQVDAIETGTVIDWANILQRYNDGRNVTKENKNAIANLMKYCGASVRMDYDRNESEAFDYAAAFALKQFFGYSDDLKVVLCSAADFSSWTDRMCQELQKGYPIFYAGEDRNGKAHAFMLEGYDENGFFDINYGWEKAGKSEDEYICHLRLFVKDGIESEAIKYHNKMSAIINVSPRTDGVTPNIPICLTPGVSTSEGKSLYWHSTETNSYENVKLLWKCFNTTPTDHSMFDLGIMIFNQTDEQIGNVIPVGSLNLPFSTKGTDKLISFDISDALDNDYYNMRLVSKASGTSEWIQSDNFYNISHGFWICNGFMAIRSTEEDLSSLTVDNLEISTPGVLRVGTVADISFTVSSHDGDYDGAFLTLLKWTDKSGDVRYDVLNIADANLKTNQTMKVAYKWVPTYEGEQELVFINKRFDETFHQALNVISTTTSLDMLEATNLTLKDGDFDKGLIDGTTLRGTLYMKNHDVVTKKANVIIGMEDVEAQTRRTKPVAVNIAPGSTVGYGFSFGNLTAEHHYVITASYASGEEFYRSPELLCTMNGLGEVEPGNEAIIAYEYWFDDNFDGKKIVSTNGNNAVIRASIDARGLSDGIHSFNFRVKRVDGKYSAVTSALFMNLKGETMECLEYWLDDDYDNRKSVSLSHTEEEQELTLDLSNIEWCPIGFHQLNIRAIDSKFGRTAVNTTGIIKIPLGTATQVEYWFDNDVANSKILNGHLSADKEGYIINAALDVSQLSVGIHHLNYRACDSENNLYGAVMSAPIMKVPSGNISRLEYWFDNDRNNIYTMGGHAAEAGDEGYIFVGDLNISNLSPGHHRLHYRGIGSDGQLSTATSSASILVKIDSHGDAVMASYSISVDGDDFIAQGLLDAKAEVDFSYVLNAKDLGKGIHTLQTTFWNSYGMSVSETTSFEVTYGDDDAINTPQADEDEDGPIYNLSGMRVNSNAKGILIKNGKKYLVK